MSTSVWSDLNIVVFHEVVAQEALDDRASYYHS
jgi:hypothetical protein